MSTERPPAPNGLNAFQLALSPDYRIVWYVCIVFGLLMAIPFILAGPQTY